MISKRISKLEYAIRDVLLPAMELEKQGHKILKLNIGDPNAYDFDTPENIRAAMINAIQTRHNGYSNSEDERLSKEAVVKRQMRLHNTKIDPNQVLLTSGVSEAIMMLFAALAEEKKHIICPNPSYPVYQSYGTLFGQENITYNCLEGRKWEPDLDDIRKKINGNTQAVVVINPNNPTGAVYSEKTLREIVNIAGENNATLIADEIYDQMVYAEFTSLGKLCKDVPTVIMNGISKNYLAPGWRIGYMGFINAPELCEACGRIARARLSVHTPSMYGLTEALNSQTHIEPMKNKLRERRDYVMKRIGEIRGLSCVKPKGAFYAFPKIEDCKNDKKWVMDLLKEEHVLAVHGSGFGCHGHFRIVYLPPINILEESFNRIEKFMKHYSPLG